MVNMKKNPSNTGHDPAYTAEILVPPGVVEEVR